MATTYLNEHDAHQGAQSAGEFLGMTGNSGWYLLGAGGATILMVVLLWGIFGIPLLLCLLVGVVLCGLAVTYVFTLKNNRPEHYDTDYFESALVEAGVVPLMFGPRRRRPSNPFAAENEPVPESPCESVAKDRRQVRRANVAQANARAAFARQAASFAAPGPGAADRAVTLTTAAAEEPEAKRTEPMVPREAYVKLEERLATTREWLEDALAEREED